jgi:hypothetical protein
MQLSNLPIHSFRARLPARSDILLVWGVVLFAVFGWSIRGFLYKLPSFALYFGVGANLAIVCYMLAFALLESMLVTGLLVLFGMLLPAGWLRDGFTYKSFLIIFDTSLAMVLFEGYYKADFFKDILAGATYPFPPFVEGAAASFMLLSALLWLFRSRPRLQKYVLYVVEQLSLFTYIYVPLGIVGLVVVLIRNLR